MEGQSSRMACPGQNTSYESDIVFLEENIAFPCHRSREVAEPDISFPHVWGEGGRVTRPSEVLGLTLVRLLIVSCPGACLSSQCVRKACDPEELLAGRADVLARLAFSDTLLLSLEVTFIW